MSHVTYLHELPEETKQLIRDEQSHLQTLITGQEEVTTRLRVSVKTGLGDASECISEHAQTLIVTLFRMSGRVSTVHDLIPETGSSCRVPLALQADSSNPATEASLPCRVLKAFEEPFLSRLVLDADEGWDWTLDTARTLLEDEAEHLRALARVIATRNAENNHVDMLLTLALTTLKNRNEEARGGV